jgi:hypothetical protein
MSYSFVLEHPSDKHMLTPGLEKPPTLEETNGLF